MNLLQISDLLVAHSSFVAVLIIVLLTSIQITPIKWNPWSAIFKWIGRNANGDLITKVNTIEEKLDNHIKESDARDIRERRTAILDFANSCMNGRKHTQEEFIFIMHECDLYEKHCVECQIPNGVADAAIGEIRRIYNECLRNNSFLV